MRDDSDLADVIEADGRWRLADHRPVPLERYLQAVLNLHQRPEPLDAAIDMALRGLAGGGRADEAAIRRLTEAHPELEAVIRESAALNDALWSTIRLHRHMQKSAPRELPCAFGPRMEDGRHRYELRELLGEGSFGEVYVAVDRKLSDADHEALVSIKILAGGERSEWTRQLLIDEATKSRRIRHPNVVNVLDRGVTELNEDFIVYEFVDGGDLYQWHRRHHAIASIREIAALVARIARGVHAAHMAGLVHCDLKPGNIVLTGEGEPKVVDFGIAIRSAEHESMEARAADESGPMGNLAFMSPEQFRREEGALTIPSDIYALGGILYWLVTGQLPNGGTPEEVRGTHDRERGRLAPPSLREARVGIDTDLDAICRRAMAQNPQDRHGSAAALADDLDAWRAFEPITWTYSRPGRRLTLWARRKPSLAAASLAIVVLGFVSALVGVKATTETRMRNEFQGKVAAYLSSWMAAEGEGLSFLTLQDLWLAEWLYGLKILGDELNRFQVWDKRIETVRNHIAIIEAKERPSPVEINIWRTSLAFWLIKRGDWREAEPEMEKVMAGWGSMLEPDDPWMDDMRILAASAAANRLVDPEAPPADAQERTDVQRSLNAAFEVLDARRPGIPLHMLTIEQLIKLHESGPLEDVAKVNRLRGRIREVREELNVAGSDD